MTRYFELFDDMYIHGRWHLGDVLLPTGEEPLLSRATPLGQEGRLLVDVSHGGRVLDFTLTAFNVPVASSALASAVAKVAGSDVQCLPAEVAGQSGMVVLNALRVVRCIDDTRSEFIKWTEEDNRPDRMGGYRQVTKLVLLPGSIPADANFFRVKGWLVALVVSEGIKNAMERAGCLGAKFYELAM
jgi:hypothetical protein